MMIGAVFRIKGSAVALIYVCFVDDSAADAVTAAIVEDGIEAAFGRFSLALSGSHLSPLKGSGLCVVLINRSLTNVYSDPPRFVSNTIKDVTIYTAS